MFQNEEHNADGRHIGYINSEEFRNLEPNLHEVLRTLVLNDRRSVLELIRSTIFASGTLHFTERAHNFLGSQTSASSRMAIRRDWSDKARAILKGADIVFFDPDNGIETKSVPVTAPKAGKYIFWDDLKPYWANGQSLIIYHHANRTKLLSAQIGALQVEFERQLGPLSCLVPMVFRRGSCRIFWIVGQPHHAEVLDRRASMMLTGGWGQHFSSGCSSSFGETASFVRNGGTESVDHDQ